MKNFIETLLNVIQKWTSKKIKSSVADWNQNDPNSDSYVKNRTHWVDENGEVHKLETKFLELPKNLATTEEVSEFKEEVRVSFEEVSTDIEELESDSADMSGKLLTYVTNRCILPFSATWDIIAYGDGKFIATASRNSARTNKIIFSNDGYHWSEIVLLSTTYGKKAAYGDGKFVVIDAYESNSSNTNIYYTIIDESNWIRRYFPVSNQWYSIAYGNGKFVATGKTNTLVYSTDGISWRYVTTPSEMKNVNFIAFTNGVFVAVSNSSSVHYSTDGINWKQSLYSNFLFGNIAVSDSRFVISGNYDGNEGGKYAYTSTDGINWEIATVPGLNPKKYHKVNFGNNKFIIFEGYQVYSSADGINWKLEGESNLYNPEAMIYENGVFIAVYDSKSYYSTDAITWYSDSEALIQNSHSITDEVRNLLLDGHTIPVPDVAEVGDTIVVKSVDAKGNPIEWETKKLATEEYVDTALENIQVPDIQDELITVEDIDRICGASIINASEVTF